jgi:hypothetical protein
MANDAQLRNQFGRAGRVRAQEQYSLQSGFQKWLAVLNSLSA